MKILDTDILTSFFHGHRGVVAHHQRESDEVAVTIVSRLQVLQGNSIVDTLIPLLLADSQSAEFLQTIHCGISRFLAGFGWEERVYIRRYGPSALWQRLRGARFRGARELEMQPARHRCGSAQQIRTRSSLLLHAKPRFMGIPEAVSEEAHGLRAKSPRKRGRSHDGVGNKLGSR